jgi:geranylgeranyl pyrophosphate synthase
VAVYAENLGLAFQIRDDILDVTGDAAELGKPTGSDAANRKTTFATLLGIDGAMRLAETLTRQAAERLRGDSFLSGLAESLAHRTN